MDLQRLRTFQILSETMHFRYAAQRLGLTQSAVSQQIASLERDLGAPLFERIGRRVYLTPAGDVLARRCCLCCSGLMAALLAAGAMDLGAMALVAPAITVERLAPWPEWTARAAGAVVAAAGALAVARALGA